MRLVISDVTVVEPRDGRSTAGQDVHVNDGRIEAVVPKAAVPGGPAVDHVVDGHGRYLVPGFNDMHAHPLVMKDPSANLRLMLAFGITGFRQMSASPALLKKRAAGTLLSDDSPRLLAMPGSILTPINAGTPERAVASVREQQDQGADFLKAGLVTAEAFYAAQAEASRLGIPILGHLPNGVDVVRASGQGMRSIEHLGPGAGLLSCCTPDAGDGHQHVAPAPRVRMPPANLPFIDTIFEAMLRRVVLNPVNLVKQPAIEGLQRTCAAFDDSAAGRLAERLAADRTWQVPTLIRSRTNFTCDDPDFRADPNLRFVASSTRRSWDRTTKRFSKFPDSSRRTFELVYATMLTLARLLDEAGVPMLAGSDACGAAWEVPGAALHQEFNELGRAGFSPLRVLQMTTSDAATFLEAKDGLGAVAVGSPADLVLLDSDPLASVESLHHVSAVVRAGKLYDTAALDALKHTVERDTPIR